MRMPFGEHEEKLLESLVLREPRYVYGLLRDEDVPARIQKEATRLIAVFDAKPYLTDCTSEECINDVTRFTVYGWNLSPQFWCDECDPYSLGARSGKIQEIATYDDAVMHAMFHCNNSLKDLKTLIRIMAGAKGLSGRIGEKQAEEFFGS